MSYYKLPVIEVGDTIKKLGLSTRFAHYKDSGKYHVEIYLELESYYNVMIARLRYRSDTVWTLLVTDKMQDGKTYMVAEVILFDRPGNEWFNWFTKAAKIAAEYHADGVWALADSGGTHAEVA